MSASSSSAEPRVRLPGLPEGFTVVRLLGRSPLSEVFLVADDEGRLRALKVLRESASKDPRIRERWRREAQLLDELSHPHLIRCYGSLDVQGRPALLLEYIEGNSLRDRLRDRALGWEESARIGVQVARALQRIHRAGALHRDVKPHNILMDDERGAVLSDLGLVRRKEDPTLTAQGAALGSPAYMSPEQARDPSEVGPEADVYSLGATLHHALSGKPPFLGTGVGEVIHRVLHLEPEPLPESVPADLVEVLRTAMAKDPVERYGRARDLANDLGRVLLGTSPRLVSRRTLRRQFWLKLGVAAGIAAMLGVGAWFFLRQGEEHSVPNEARAETNGSEIPTQTQPTTEAEETQQADPDTVTDPVAASRLRFIDWARPYEQAYRRYLVEGRLRDALDEIRVLEESPLPEEADAHFRHLRERLVDQAREAIRAKAEQTAADAERILREERERIRLQVEEGSFYATRWRQGVEAAWAEAGLTVDHLPLEPGGPDPRQRLFLAANAMQREAKRYRDERALASSQRIRRESAELLREGRFEAAKRLWANPDYGILTEVREGKLEAHRANELWLLEQRVLNQLSLRRGDELTLALRAGALHGRVVQVPGTEAEQFALETQINRLPIHLMRLDPDGLPEFLGVDDPFEDARLWWQLAHLQWCQGRTALAVDRMRELLPISQTETKRAPLFWVTEWEAELALSESTDRTASAPERGAGTEGDEAAESDAIARVVHAPSERLAADWAALLDGAEVTAVEGGGVEVVWENPDWSVPWRYDLKWERRQWELESWSLEWRLPADQIPPLKLSWLTVVDLQHQPNKLPRILIGEDIVLEGYGIVPGADQILEWKQGRVWLDGLDLAPLDHEPQIVKGSRVLLLRSLAVPSFPLERVRLKVGYRKAD